LQRVADNGLVYYQFESLLPFASNDVLRHGVFTRLGGVSAPPFATLNTGSTVGDAPAAVLENRRRICRALDVAPEAVATGFQVHGTQVALIGPQDRGCVQPAIDILLTDRPGIPLMQRFADCVPLLLYDPLQPALGLAHAGWRGTVQQVALTAVRAMTQAFGSRPETIIAGVGPSIGPCCYQVGPEVAAQVRNTFRNDSESLLTQHGDRHHLDLWQANRRQLEIAGVRQIEVAGLCTACRTDEFFSHRAEKGRTGRFGLLAVLLGK